MKIYPTMRSLLAFISFFAMTGFASAQCKTYRLSANRDTLDCVDMQGLKQGPWIIKAPPLRGEPGYEEEGIFINGKKEGQWRRYNTMGDLLAIETFQWGLKNGISKYSTPIGPEREEVWRAVNPDKVYDTIAVQDPANPNRYELVVIKNEGRSMKHGNWKYYYPATGALIRIEKYVLDKLQEPDAENVVKSMTKVTVDTAKGKTAAVPEKPKPKEVMEYEKKNAGKKSKVRDGRTGG